MGLTVKRIEDSDKSEKEIEISYQNILKIV